MQTELVPFALRDRLGPEATGGLVDLFDIARREWVADVVTIVTDRFERRLAQEVAGLKTVVVEGDAQVRHEMAAGFALVRSEIAETKVELRSEIAETKVELCREIAETRVDLCREIAHTRVALQQQIVETRADLRLEIAGIMPQVRQNLAETRVELLKWSFYFWIGQVVALASLMAVMLRMMRA
jgi:hypothetical protein